MARAGAADFRAQATAAAGRIAAEREAIRQLEERIAGTERERDEVARLVADGLDEAAADKQLEAIDATVRKCRRGIDGHVRVIGVVEQDVAKLREQAGIAAYNEAYTELERSAEKAGEDSRMFARTLKQAATQATRLRASRAAVDEALSVALELKPDDVVEWEPPAGLDEPGWPDGLKELAGLVKAGPRQPNAKAERERARRQRDQQAARHRQIVEAAHGYGSAFRSLDAEGQAEALELRARRRAERESRQAREREAVA